VPIIQKGNSMYGDTTIRKRPVYYNSGGRDTVRVSGVSYPTDFKYVVVGGQKTISTETIYPYLRKARKQGFGKKLSLNNVDAGGNFFTSKAWASEATPLNITYFSGGGAVMNNYVGTQCAYQSSINLSPLAELTVSEVQALMAYGSTAISRCIPTNPVSGLANFLGELRRDGLPSLPGAQMRDNVDQMRKGIGSEYLNLEFALKPTISDLRKFASVVKDHDRVLRQYERDSGKPIRRKYSFPTQKTVTNSVISTNYRPSGVPSKYFPSGGTLSLETVTTVDRWFSGSFCYYLNTGDGGMRDKLQSYEQKANKLLGTRITPELLWNLAPWSWASDWFFNTGDVLTNVSAFLHDGLVMRRGYVMERTYMTQTYSLTGYTGQAGVPTPPLIQVFHFERKVRIKASPFGFGLTDGDLSLRQKAIIAALGLSQSGNLAK
jgi:hypothetical protein